MKKNININYKYLLAVFILFSWRCGENSEENLKKFNAIKADIINNYQYREHDFNKLNSYFRLNHIKCIEFSKDQISSIQYRVSNHYDTGEVKEIRNKDPMSSEILPILNLDSLKQNELLKLRECLSKINCNKFRIIDYYNNLQGKYSKEIDLHYNKNMNGLNFFYRMFQQPLDSIPNGYYNILINGDTTGAVLSKNVVWYYK